MKKSVFILLLLLCLFAANALAAPLADPAQYVGAWEGGDDYGETREYYLEIRDYQDGLFTVTLDIYRIWGFDDMTALLAEDEPTAVLATPLDAEYAVLATLDFADAAVNLTVLESDFPDLPAETTVTFTRSAG